MTHLIYYCKCSLIALSAMVLFFTSCDKEDNEDSTSDQTIAGIVVSNSSYSSLEAAVVKANLQNTLSGAGPFTVFAPDDAAFTASGITSATINGLTQQQLASILLYHTVNTKIPAASVPTGPNAKVTTVSGDSIFVTKNSGGVFINGIRVEQPDITASNGVFHRIEKVLQRQCYQ